MRSAPTADPVLLEVFNNLFMAIAEQMGVTLANTAYSVNIKERLDFSCALFDAAGNLIANAPHMPVHLGSMGESVKHDHRRAARETMRPGDVFVLNAPVQRRHAPARRDGDRAGVPRPTPAVSPRAGEGATPPCPAQGERTGVRAASPSSTSLRAVITPTSAASRPGSMPPASTHVDEEGVLLDNVQLVAEGRFLEDEMRAILAGGRYPVAQRRAEPRRPARAGGGLRERRRGADEDGRRISACRSCAPT